jgi:hypothetical protein
MIMISDDQSAKPSAILADVVRDLDEAFKQAREAYAFAPLSYTASAFAAIATARDAFGAIATEASDPETEPSTVEALPTVEAADDLL